MKTITQLSIAVCFTVVNLSAQAPFQKSYYDPAGEMLFQGYFAKTVKQTSDQGYLLFGSRSVTFEVSNDYLLKTDADGNFEWSLTIGEGSNPASFFETADGGFFITGSYYIPFFGAVRTYVVRTNALGDTLWTKMLGSGGFQATQYYCNSICLSSGGNYVLIGATGEGNISVTKMDTSGNSLWMNTFGSSGFDYGYDVKQTADGGFVFVGTPSLLLAKTNQAGALTWTKSYDIFTPYALPVSLEITADKGFIISGNIQDPLTNKYNAFCMRADSLGNVNWAKAFGDSLSNDKGGNILPTSDGGFIMPISMVDSTRSVATLLKLDATGNLQWTKTVADSCEEPRIGITADGGYIIAGKRSLNPVLIKTDLLGNNVNCNLSDYPVTEIMLTPTLYSLSFSQSNDNLTHLSDVYNYKITLSDSNITCQPGFVWPGDANSDGIANNQDILAIGIAYGFTGVSRPNATTNWIGQPCPDWVDTFSNGVNFKHADCNGEGLVDSSDVSIISLNYGLTHAKTGSPQRAVNPDLFLVFSQDTFQTGDTVSGEIHLASQAAPVNNVYGIAFSLTYDQNIIDSNGINIDFINSWFTSQTNRVGLAKDLYSASRTDIGLSRTNHSNASGFGAIANVSFVIQDNIDGKDYFVLPLEIQFEDVVAIDKDEAAVNITANGDTLYVEGETVGINPIHQNYNVQIFPNPAADEINVMADVAIVECRILDLMGREVASEIPSLQGMESLTLDVSALETGSYFIHLKTTDHYSICRKIVVHK